MSVLVCLTGTANPLELSCHSICKWHLASVASSIKWSEIGVFFARLNDILSNAFTFQVRTQCWCQNWPQCKHWCMLVWCDSRCDSNLVAWCRVLVSVALATLKFWVSHCRKFMRNSGRSRICLQQWPSLEGAWAVNIDGNLIKTHPVLLYLLYIRTAVWSRAGACASALGLPLLRNGDNSAAQHSQRDRERSRGRAFE